MTEQAIIESIRTGLHQGKLIPFLGPAMLELAGADCPLPATPGALVKVLTAKVSVPHKIRHLLTAATQFMENFKHRKTVVAMMNEAFAAQVPPTPFHLYLANLPNLPLLIHAWYDDLPQQALAGRDSWGIVQGVSQSEHYGSWVHYFRPDGSHIPHKTAGDPDLDGNGVHGLASAPDDVLAWKTLLYQPVGSVRPAANYLVSDSDYVEVLTEIDIQTPIPLPVQEIRVGRNLLFLGYRFNDQLDRTWARQIAKRSGGKHWAVLPEAPTRNETRFFEEVGITPIMMPLADFAAALMAGEAVRL